MTAIVLAGLALAALLAWPVKRAPRVRPLDERRLREITEDAVLVDWPLPCLLQVGDAGFRAVSLAPIHEGSSR